MKELKVLGKLATYFVTYIILQLSVVIVYLINVIRDSLSINPNLNIEEVGSIIEKSTGSLTGLQMTADTLFILLVIFVARFRMKKVKKHYNLVKFNKKTILPIMIFGMSFNLVLTLILGLIPFPESWMITYNEVMSMIVTDNVIMLFLSIVIFAPITEELLYRSIMLGRLKTVLPTVVAVILSSLLFGAIHGNIIQTIYASLLGVFLGYIFVKTQSLLASILCHASFNLVAFMLILFPLPQALQLGLSAVCIPVSIISYLKFIKITKQNQMIFETKIVENNE